MASTVSPSSWRASCPTFRLADSRTRADRTARAAKATPTNDRARRTPSGARSLRISGQGKAITAAEHGLDDPWRVRVLLDLPAEVLHVGVDGPLVAFELVAAPAVDQLVPRVDPSGDAGKRHEDAPLGRRELDHLAAGRHGPAVLVDDECAAPEGGCQRRGPFRRD